MRAEIMTRRVRHPVARIKQSCSYDVYEVAKLLGVHRNTVRRWLTGGLAAIDARRPTLVHGSALKAFLTAKRRARERQCGVGEFFCFRCREPRRPWGDMAYVERHTAKIVRLSGLCAVCETGVHRLARHADVPKLASVIELIPLGSERLTDRGDANVNSDFERFELDGETKPAK
jgi:excisionase family DNA binding protein